MGTSGKMISSDESIVEGLWNCKYQEESFVPAPTSLNGTAGTCSYSECSSDRRELVENDLTNGVNMLVFLIAKLIEMCL